MISYILFSQHCDKILQRNKDFFLSPRYILKVGIQQFLDAVQNDYPEIDNQRKLQKYLPFFIQKRSQLGWSHQCCCTVHGNFIEAISYINRLGEHVNNQILTLLSYDKVEELACNEAKSISNEYERNMAINKCFQNWSKKHCFQHKKYVPRCKGSRNLNNSFPHRFLDCSHKCQPKFKEILLDCLEKGCFEDFCPRFPRHIQDSETKRNRISIS